MTNPKVVTFDCAQTLMKVDWQPTRLAVRSAELAGLEFDPQVAGEIYDRKLRSRWPEFKKLNRTRREAVLAEFWRELTADWLVESGMPADRAGDVMTEANNLLFGESSEVFSVYDDVAPCLDRLTDGGFRLAVISNWDNSLHRALRSFGLSDYFEVVIASLEEGVEKPDPALFHIALERLGVGPGEAAHVGDNPIDDLQGARNVGMRGLLIDRERGERSDSVITSLDQLPEVLGL